MKNQTTLYKKVGRKYVEYDTYLDETGLPVGLYLFYNPNHKGEHKSMRCMIHHVKVHDIQNVGKFSDLIAGHEEELSKKICEIIHKGNYSAFDLTNAILAELSKF